MSDPWGSVDDSAPESNKKQESSDPWGDNQEEPSDSWETKKYDSTAPRGDRRPRGRGRRADFDRGGRSHHYEERKHEDDRPTRGNFEGRGHNEPRGHHEGRGHYEGRTDRPRYQRRGERGRFPRSRPDGDRGRHNAERAKIKRHRMFENKHDKQVIYREDEQQIDPEALSTQSHFRSDREWDELNIPKNILEAIEEIGYIYPSKIQSFGIDVILQEGFENLIAQAPNGSGKTATFIIGSLSRVDLQNPKVQVICIGHTIELTNQLFHEYEKFTTRIGIKMTMLNKEARLEDIGQVLVTLPGSFSKLLKKKCDFSSLKAFVVDEADHLLDSKNSAEFYNSLNYAIQSSVIPKSAQFLLFSATFNEEIKTDIVKLLREMNEITIKKEELMLDLIKHLYFRCDQQQKITTFEQILKRVNTGIAVSFVNTCDFANRVYNKVQNSGHKAALLMGRDMTVDERNLTMQDFREGRYSVLITTNLLARGIDNTKVNCVVNFDLPRIIRSKEMDYVLYLHRSGRCSRFGRSGICINLITSDHELEDLTRIQNYYNISMSEITNLEELEKMFEEMRKDTPSA